MNPHSFAFPLVEGSTSFFVTIDLAGSQPACAAELKPQLLSVPLQDGLGFSSVPLPGIPTALRAEAPASTRRDVGFTN